MEFLGRSHRIHTWVIPPLLLPSERREKNEDMPTWRPEPLRVGELGAGAGLLIDTSKSVAGKEIWPIGATPEPN